MIGGEGCPRRKGPRPTHRHGRAEWVRRGDDHTHQHHKREPGFFAIKIQERFELSPRWYRKGEVRDLVLEYYCVLRSVLRTNPPLRRCLTRCSHCGIFFLTDPRNAKRNDLGCPFGCREAHRKRSSTKRSVAYYRTRAGKFKKQLQNDKRRRVGQPAERESRPPEEKKPLGKQMPGAPLEELGFDAGMVSYLRMATTLIEGRRVSREEILEMLARALRQHSMEPRRRVDYCMWYLNRDPP